MAKGPVNIPYLFVTAAQGSGSTWLCDLLNSHRQIVCLREPKLFHNIIRPFAAWKKQYNDDLKARKKEDIQFADNQFAELVQAAYNGLFVKRDLKGVKYIGEKTPENLHNLPIIGECFKPAKFIHIVRDPRDAAVSCYFKEKRIKGKADWDTYVPEYLRAFWTPYNAKFIEFLAKREDDCLIVRYEDLHGETAQTLETIFKFLKVKSNPADIQGIIDSNSFKKVTNRNRGQEDQSSFYRKGIVGDWRNHEQPILEKAFEIDGVEQLSKAFGYAA